MTDSFVFYRSFYNAVKLLPKDEQLGFFFSVCDFAFDEKEPELSGDMQEAMFALMRPNISASVGRYISSVENGKKGGAPKGNQNAKKQPKNNLKTTQENNLKQPKKTTQNNPDKTTQNNLNKNINKNIFISDTSEGFKTHSDAPEVERERLLKKLEQDKADRLKKEAEEYRAAEEREAARRKAIEDAKNSMREASGGDTI